LEEYYKDAAGNYCREGEISLFRTCAAEGVFEMETLEAVEALPPGKII
jgi:hypothetical protein